MGGGSSGAGPGGDPDGADPGGDAPGEPPGEPERADIPGVRLRRWNPYGKVGPEGRRFVQHLARFPNVTAGIIGVLVLVYGAMVAAGWELTLLLPPMWSAPVGLAFGAMDADLVRQGEWWRLFTAALLHGSLLHLGFNSFMLYQLGRLAENIYGRMGLVILFVGSAVCGGLASALLGGAMSVGASGAVMGLVGANLVFGLRHKARIPEFLHGLFGPTLLFYLALMLLIGLVPGVDGWGHAGGAVSGALLGMLLPKVILRPEGAPPVRLVALPFAAAVATAAVCVAMVLPGIADFSGGDAADLRRDFERALETGRLDEAAAVLDEIEVGQPDNPVIPLARMHLAEVAMVDLDWPAAVRQLEAIDASDPDIIAGSHAFQNNFAWALFMAYPEDGDRVARGVALVRAALDESEDNATYLNTLAWGLYLQGDDAGALAAIERAIRENRGRALDADIYIHVAALLATGEREEAIEIYRQAVIDFPDGVLHAEVSAVITAAERSAEGAPFPRLAWLEDGGPADGVNGGAPIPEGPVAGASPAGAERGAEATGSGGTGAEPGGEPSPPEAASPGGEVFADPAVETPGAGEVAGDRQGGEQPAGWHGRRATWD